MNSDGFEKKIQRQPLRRIPSDWRAVIIQTAQESTSSVRPREEPALVGFVVLAWRELIQPWRYAWSGMAAFWLICLILNVRMQLAETAGQVSIPTRVASERIRFCEEQRRALVELTGSDDWSPAEPRRPAQPKRHGQRTVEVRRC